MQAREVASPIRWGILSTANISVKSVAPAIIVNFRRVMEHSLIPQWNECAKA